MDFSEDLDIITAKLPLIGLIYKMDVELELESTYMVKSLT